MQMEPKNFWNYGNESKLYKKTHQAYTQFASVSSVAVLLWVVTCEYIRGNFILGAGGAQKAANVLYKFWCSEMRTETNSNRWRTHYSNALYIVSASGQDVYTYLIRVAGAQERASPDAAAAESRTHQIEMSGAIK
jgi:hypothetical protein